MIKCIAIEDVTPIFIDIFNIKQVLSWMVRFDNPKSPLQLLLHTWVEAEPIVMGCVFFRKLLISNKVSCLSLKVMVIHT